MLKDSLLAYCNKEYDYSCAGHCETQCNNKNNCEHNCDNCLAQVHWLQENNGRRDYNCPFLLLKYVLRFTNKYSGQVLSALGYVNLSEYPEYNVFSIGCGGAPDLMAIEEIAEGKRIYYKGYDRNCLWQKIHNQIERYAESTCYLDAKLRQYDIFDVFNCGKPQHRQYNIVVIQYLLSHLFNTGQSSQIEYFFDSIIKNVVLNRYQHSPFLIIITDIDSLNKGRNTWYILLDKLEEAGYCGIAYARSAFPTGDLGETRWSSKNHKLSSSFGNIKYNYIKNSSERDGAQLIIELR